MQNLVELVLERISECCTSLLAKGDGMPFKKFQQKTWHNASLGEEKQTGDISE